MMRKKMLAGIAAGVIMTGVGFGILGGQAQAAENAAQRDRNCPPPMHAPHHAGQPPMMQRSADDVAKQIHETFGVDEQEVKAALEQHKDFRDIGQAAMLSKISGKSFKDVMDMKTDEKHWPEVSQELGVTREQIHDQMNEMTAARMSERENVDKDTALKLLNNGYRPMDIVMAAKLAKLSGNDIQSVLNRKKINNNWGDVAEQLGVDRSKLRPEHPMGDGPQGGPPPEMNDEAEK